MPPRRSHKKSRAGCRRCKSRKIKCDEARPRCSNCDKHGVNCDFEFPELASGLSPNGSRSPSGSKPGLTPVTRPASSRAASRLAARTSSSTASTATLGPPPPSPSCMSALTATTPSTPAGRILELRLLHHFTTVTFKTLSSSNEKVQTIWRDFVPRAAFAAASGSTATASNHLTDGILAIAALHLRTLAPHDRELISASHAYMASSLSEYNRLLKLGINPSNAVALFLNAALIAFQSAAARIFNKEEPAVSIADIDEAAAGLAGAGAGNPSISPSSTTANSTSSTTAAAGNPGAYGLPMSWFHAFQGVKTITAASWQWLRSSDIVLPIINAQPPLHLDIAAAHEGFFGHLLDGLDEELTGLSCTAGATGNDATWTPKSVFSFGRSPFTQSTSATGSEFDGSSSAGLDDGQGRSRVLESPPMSRLGELMNENLFGEDDDVAQRTRHAYQHAVAVLNWAHSSPYNGACLVFPATVSRHFVDLLGSRSYRAITILACFFAMLKTLDRVWWLQGMARREVLGIVSMFNSDAIPMDVERRWWPHVQWAVRVALYHDDNSPTDYVPPDVWGCSPCYDVPENGQTHRAPESFVSHIDMVSESINGGGASVEFNYPGLI
ncbi:c6 zinc finger domain containing protein [Grosmannia clavigera kw1407]|uniref:C6 zinc finger domain containing protein n=1 Tax=Grosmannia clavigera (strain kw1407 / UAMH 11150) TaxID=655863 RepID=F0XSE7_GROCL|nr:c6 zinc finger domain containing protein [Grosmannia clavigera kw1407]EFW99462.1 c6 zinc finger domain containing protein [Grosmannia clavigera kw1407]